MIVYVYSKCSTCKAALHYLKEKNIACEVKEITLTPPTLKELQNMLAFKKNNLKKLFNTSGHLYKELHLKSKLDSMAEKDALSLLNQHGMLVKRPFVLSETFGLLGFKEEEWNEIFEA